MLFMSPEVRQELYAWSFREEVPAATCIPHQLQLLFARLQTRAAACSSGDDAGPGRPRAVDTMDLMRSFGWSGSDVFVQHDTSALFRVLLEALDRALGKNILARDRELRQIDADDPEEDRLRREVCLKYDAVIDKRKEFVLTELFQTEHVQVLRPLDRSLRPPGAGKDFSPDDLAMRKSARSLGLQLSVSGIGSLDEAIRASLKPEHLVAEPPPVGDNRWECAALGCRVDAELFSEFRGFPPLLIIELQRIKFCFGEMKRVKLGHRVEFPFVLDMSPYLPETLQRLDRKSTYDLYCVQAHAGMVGMGQHFVLAKSIASGSWFKFDDSVVSAVSKEEVQRLGFGKDPLKDEPSRAYSTCAYMLVYRATSLGEQLRSEEIDLPARLHKLL